MKNDYVVDGNTTIIFIENKYGMYETTISTADLPRISEEVSAIYVHLWDSTPYAVARTKNKKRVLLHRFIMEPPKGMEIDHLNRSGLDNRRENLKICTRAENAKNKRYRADYSHHPRNIKP